jgi:urocanate reductase
MEARDTMKQRFIFTLTILVLITVFGCAVFSKSSRMEKRAVSIDGIYHGAGKGYRGSISVQVRMEGGSIASIDIIDSDEDLSVGGAAMEELIDLIITYNTTDIDAISGATETSRGFLEAVENAIFMYE